MTQRSDAAPSSAGVFTDLAAEERALDTVLDGLDAGQWAAPSAAPGWTVADVVLHLAQSEEAVVASFAGTPSPLRGVEAAMSLDDVMARRVASERGAPHHLLLERWRAACGRALTALRSCPNAVRLEWAVAALSPTTLATTRLAEHWVHALDITDALSIPYEGSPRLQRIAWLAHRTLPYAFTLAGEQPAAVRCELRAPDGVTLWRFGPAEAEAVISGDADAFCRVAAQRLSPAESRLAVTGEDAWRALHVLRTYAV